MVEEKKVEPKLQEAPWRKMIIETNGKDIRMSVCEMSLLEVKEIGRSLTVLQ